MPIDVAQEEDGLGFITAFFGLGDVDVGGAVLDDLYSAEWSVVSSPSWDIFRKHFCSPCLPVGRGM